MVGLQEFIHKIEEGEGVRVVKFVAVSLLLVTVTLLYDTRAFRNFTAPEAMDAAQLARNLATHQGYTTHCVRPLSMYLLQKKRGDDNALLKAGHPDLSNPPVYPAMLAGLMRLAPWAFRWQVPEASQFSAYRPELVITAFNQLWFLASVVLLYLLAKRLFNAPVAWMSAALFFFTDLLWRFSSSGLSTMCLLAIFLSVAWCLARLVQGLEEGQHGPLWFFGWAGGAGALVGIGLLTRYSFGALLAPVLAYLALFSGPRRRELALTALLTFGLVAAPWLVRNYRLSGTLFGTAGYAVYQETLLFSGNGLERSLQPDQTKLAAFGAEETLRKIALNSKEILQNDLPKLGGNWLSAFFLVGLLVPFQKASISRLRVFLLFCLVCLIVTQALGRTHWGIEEGEVSSENLLVIATPLVLMFGAALYHLLLDQIEVPFPEVRRLITLLVGLVASAPLLCTLAQKAMPASYPPYMPWLVQQATGFMKPNELIMSDMPWAVAWYGGRQSVWLSLDPGKDFYAINDYQKPVSALYLTQITLDARFLSRLVKGQDRAWGQFILQCLAARQLPKGFPLTCVWQYLLLTSDQMLVTDWERWNAVGR